MEIKQKILISKNNQHLINDAQVFTCNFMSIPVVLPPVVFISSSFIRFVRSLFLVDWGFIRLLEKYFLRLQGTTKHHQIKIGFIFVVK